MSTTLRTDRLIPWGVDLAHRRFMMARAQRPPPRDRTRLRRSEARPGELVEAALALFSERGFAATRLEDVAARAGVSKGTVYLYFDSKEQLFEAVVRQAMSPNIERIEALVESSDGETEEVIRLVIGSIGGAVVRGQMPGIIKLVVAESGNFPSIARLYVDAVIERAIPLFRRILERGMARGEVRRVDPSAAWPLFIAPVMLLALWQRTFARHVTSALDPEAVLSAHVDVLLHGLLLEKPRRPRSKG